MGLNFILAKLIIFSENLECLEQYK